MAKLTFTQQEQTVFEFLQRHVSEYQGSPFIREIQQGCPIASYNSALVRLNALEHRGDLKRAPNKHRGITLVSQALQEPEQAVHVDQEAVQVHGAL